MRYLLFIFLVTICVSAFAQLPYVVVEEIQVLGNNKTKAQVILRELAFKEGDTILLENLPELLQTSESFLMNTALFSRVAITYQDWKAANNHLRIQVQVKETWYIYPIPSFELADRNFNVWWVEHNASLARTNIGLDFTHLNATGRGDRLKASFQVGYTQNYKLKYITQALNKAQTLGMTANFVYAQNREVNYATIENRQVFFNNEEDYSYYRFIGEMSLTYRPGLRKTHSFGLGFRQNRINEVVAASLNPGFFLEAKNFQRFALLEYTYSYDDRDIRAYPWEGSYFGVSIEKDGLGIYQDRNALTSLIEYQIYQPFLKNFSFGLVSKFKYSFIRNEQPYNDNRAIGFEGNHLRGYEYYVIDGPDMLLLNSSIKHPILKTEIKLGRLMPVAAFRNIPFRLNISINNDLGYVNNPFDKGENPFNNRLLWGTGLGLDMIFFFDFVFRIEYSFNHLGESGVFLNFSSNI